MDGSDGGTSSVEDRLSYRPSLDGLRAFAIAPVLVLHYSAKRWLPGGWLGVNVFFVLSGFLITRILLDEHRARGRISLRAFYRRRVARLVPALVVLCGVVGALALFGVFSDSVGPGIVSSLTYTANWLAIARGFGVLGPFAALWSLALEEQYYLLWSIAFLVLARRCARPAMARVARWAAIVAFAEVALRSHSSGSGAALYAGTFGQGMAFLLAGSALALTIPLDEGLVGSRVANFARRSWPVAVAVVALFVSFSAPNDARAHYPTVGLPLIAVCMVVIVVAALVSTPLAAFVALRPFVFLGRRSYGIYLWHVPVYEAVAWARPGLSQGALGTASAVITLAVATVSWRFLEQPFRRRISTGRWRPDVAGDHGPGADDVVVGRVGFEPT